MSRRQSQPRFLSSFVHFCAFLWPNSPEVQGSFLRPKTRTLRGPGSSVLDPLFRGRSRNSSREVPRPRGASESDSAILASIRGRFGDA